MISLKTTRPLRSAIRRLVLAAFVIPTLGASQPSLDSVSVQEQQILDEIDREMSFNDLNSLDQVPMIRRLMNREKERGNATAAWYLEQGLLALADQNPDDLRSAGILAAAGDNRLDILRRYDAGEFPPELKLGCFYDDSGQMNEARLRGSQPIAAARVAPNGRNCGAGDRTRARRAINASAQWFYLRALALLDRNGAQASTEVPELLMKLVRSSYIFTNPELGAQSLQNLLAYEVRNSQDWLSRINARVLIADWDLLYARELGTKFEESALANYQRAYDLAIENGVPEESIAEIFSPALPVMLPSFLANPLVSEESPRSKGYIEMALVVTAVGKSDDIEVLDQSEDMPRSAVKDLIRTIKFGRFRPQLRDGSFIETDPVVVRYYVNE